MNSTATLRNYLRASPIVAAAGYVGVVIVLLFLIVSAMAGLLGQRADLAASAVMLEQLEGRRPAAAGTSGGTAMPLGSAFLEGATVTIAGASLLQHMATLVTKFGGNVLSSQVELQGTQAKTGFLSMIASCEIDQTQLQPLLYEIEAGMPFLFVDQLVVEAPGASASGAASDSDGKKLRILLAVSGQWRGAK
jgi:general secretion pathway protein M